MTIVFGLVAAVLAGAVAVLAWNLRTARRDLRMVDEQLGGPGATPAVAESATQREALVEDALRELLDQAREGQQGERELQLYGPPPEVLELRALPLRLGERRIGAVGFVRDISELRLSLIHI